MAKKCSFVFKSGMCSDDGRAISGWFQSYTNDYDGRGFWDEGECFFGTFDVEEAIAHFKRIYPGYEVSYSGSC